MTVERDLKKALGIAESVMGDQAEAWIDEPQERFAGASPYELIERGRTDDVLAVLRGEADDSAWDEGD